MKRRTKTTLLILVAGIGVALIVAWFGWGKAMLEVVGRRASLDVMSASPADYGFAYESFRVQNEDGVKIAGWWIPAAEDRGTVIMAHGIGMNKSHMLPRAMVLLDAGFNTILIDLRARGESGGRLTSSGINEANDIRATMDYFAQHYGEHRPLILYGFSYGSRAVLFATENSNLVDAVIAESPFISARESFKRYFNTSWAPPMPDRNLLESVERYINHPLLLLIGDGDPQITVQEASELHRIAKDSASALYVFSNTGHSVFREDNRTEYTEIVVGFLQKL